MRSWCHHTPGPGCRGWWSCRRCSPPPVVVLQALGHVAARHHAGGVALFEGALDMGGDGPAPVAHRQDVHALDHQRLHGGIRELAPGHGHGHGAHPGDDTGLAALGVAPAQGGGVDPDAEAGVPGVLPSPCARHRLPAHHGQKGVGQVGGGRFGCWAWRAAWKRASASGRSTDRSRPPASGVRRASRRKVPSGSVQCARRAPPGWRCSGPAPPPRSRPRPAPGRRVP